MQVMSELNGLFLMIAFGGFMFLITWMYHSGKDESGDSFLVANRNIGLLRGSFSIAASWIWAPALFISSQKAYQQGLPGAFWFIVPNIAALVVFGFLAVRIRKLMPMGYTLPQYIKKRYDTKTHVVYVFMFLALQVCSVAVQLLAGASVLSSLTGLSILKGTMLLAFIFTSYSLVSGLRASIITDFMQMAFILFTCIIVVPMVVFSGSGIEMLMKGIGGHTGNFTNVFDPEVAITFGIVVTIGLLAGPIGDQQHWQRAFALREGNVKKSYILSGLIFGIVPILLSLLGFVAAGMVMSGALVVDNAQLSGVAVVVKLLPMSFVVFFIFMILSGLASTGDSALCAASSIFAIDVYKEYINKEANDKEIVIISRVVMISVSILAIGLALIPGMKILYLFLFYGTMRACDMMPTVLSLFMPSLTSKGVFWGIVSSVAIGLPMFIYGKLSGGSMFMVAASLTVVSISTVVPILLREKKKI